MVYLESDGEALQRSDKCNACNAIEEHNGFDDFIIYIFHLVWLCIDRF